MSNYASNLILEIILGNISFTHTEISLSCVSITTSGFFGGSYFEVIPVKSLINPFRAFSYNPLTSLFYTLLKMSKHIFQKIFNPTMSLIIFLSEIRGEINAALTIIPASIMSLEISATRLMFSNLSFG